MLFDPTGMSTKDGVKNVYHGTCGIAGILTLIGIGTAIGGPVGGGAAFVFALMVGVVSFFFFLLVHSGMLH